MSERNLRVVKWLGQLPAVGVCTFCDRQLKVPMSALKNLGDARESLRVQFAEHTCNRVLGGLGHKMEEKGMPAMTTQGESNPDSGPRKAAEHVAGAHDLLKSLRDKVGEHPEIGQAIHKLEVALAFSKCKQAGCFEGRYSEERLLRNPFCQLLLFFCVTVAARGQEIDPRLMDYINAVKAIDNHAHVIAPDVPDDEGYDALRCDVLPSTPGLAPANLRFGADTQATWKVLYGVVPKSAEEAEGKRHERPS